jgi:hypothetical protein
MQIKRLSESIGTAIRIAVHGPAGAGKTRLIRSLVEPVTDAPPVVTDPARILIVSAEAGLLSLAGFEASVVEMTAKTDRLATLREIHRLCRTERPFDAVCIDSITEFANMALHSAKDSNRDGRAAYGEMQDELARAMVGIRSLGVLTYVSCQSYNADGVWSPLMPGTKLGPAVGYEFDELLYLDVHDTEAGPVRQLTAQRTGTIEAKDRSGKLAQTEPACLSHIIRRIKGA